ncbi:MAG: low affinity iron permease family protein [Bacteroidetes bacterium]|nr:MAG: low affinity iron permease family protein [Bacteroidota bacterium]
MNKKQVELETKQVNKRSLRYFFDKMATRVTKASGRPAAFVLACVIVIAWLIMGPIFNFSDTWQLVINTGTTIITFLMVFIIQQTQNKDTIALQIKLNELIASSEFASNRLVDVEDLTEEELETLKNFYVRLAELAKKERDIHKSHSLDEAKLRHKKKLSVLLNKNTDNPG